MTIHLGRYWRPLRDDLRNYLLAYSPQIKIKGKPTVSSIVDILSSI